MTVMSSNVQDHGIVYASLIDTPIKPTVLQYLPLFLGGMGKAEVRKLSVAPESTKNETI